MPAQPRPARASILGVGSLLPSSSISTIEQFTPVAEKYSLRPDTIERLTGIGERRQAPADSRPSDLASAAAMTALASAGLTPSHIDCVIFTGVYKDHDEPPTAQRVADALAVNAYCEAFDLRNACNGTISAVKTAIARVEAGLSNYVLVCTGELGTQQADLAAKLLLSKPENKKLLKRSLAAFTLGDIGGALVIGRASRRPHLQPMGWDHRTAPGTYKFSKVTDVRSTVLRADSGLLRDSAAPLVREIVHSLLRANDLLEVDIDHVIVHQASKEAIIAHSSLLSNFENCVTPHYHYTGNLISASLIFGLSQIWDIFRDGDLTLVSLQGGGVSAHAALFRWSDGKND